MRIAAIVIATVGLVGSVAAAPGTAANRAGSASLRLDVGPAVVASGRTDIGQFSCSDRAKCVFEVPLSSTFEISASAPAGHRFEWTGCSRQAAADRCTVEVTANPAHVTVR